MKINNRVMTKIEQNKTIIIAMIINTITSRHNNNNDIHLIIALTGQQKRRITR